MGRENKVFLSKWKKINLKFLIVILEIWPKKQTIMKNKSVEHLFIANSNQIAHFKSAIIITNRKVYLIIKIIIFLQKKKRASI